MEVTIDADELCMLQKIALRCYQLEKENKERNWWRAQAIKFSELLDDAGEHMKAAVSLRFPRGSEGYQYALRGIAKGKGYEVPE